jgi:hypothetical protein
MTRSTPKQLVVCINHEGYLALLERRKIYVALRDAQADEHGLMRIIDESGEDLFRLIALPQTVKKAVLNAA